MMACMYVCMAGVTIFIYLNILLQLRCATHMKVWYLDLSEGSVYPEGIQLSLYLAGLKRKKITVQF